MQTAAILTALIGFIGLVAAGCSGTDGGAGPQRTAATTSGSAGAPAGGGSAKFVHAVFFSLKEGTTDAQIDQLIDDAYAILAKVPTVRRIDTGRRDTRMMRDVNDKDFSVGLVVYFDDKEGHDVYATHTLHQQYIERNKETWGEVRVFDFVAQ